MNEYNLLSTNVKGRYNVSTGFRRSSAAVSSPPWYFETIIWRLDTDRKRAEMVSMEDSGRYEDVASRRHAAICINLIAGMNGQEPTP